MVVDEHILDTKVDAAARSQLQRRLLVRAGNARTDKDLR